MKLVGLFFYFALGQKRGPDFCDIGELVLPDNADKWLCPNAKNGQAPTRDECKLQCKVGFKPERCTCLITIKKFFSKRSSP